MDPITKTELKEYYGKLCNEKSNNSEEGTEEERRSEVTDGNEDMITIEELNRVLKHAKTGKVVDYLTYQWNCGNLEEVI